MTIHAWKIKGKGGSDHDIKSYEFFIKNHCVSCGWSFPNVPLASIPCRQLAAREYKQSALYIV